MWRTWQADQRASALALFGAVGARMGLRLAAAAVVLGVGRLSVAAPSPREVAAHEPGRVKRSRRSAREIPCTRSSASVLHREILEQQIIDDVRRAKLVVVDGDRIAVALGYDRDKADAPVIVAKGERLGRRHDQGPGTGGEGAGADRLGFGSGAARGGAGRRDSRVSVRAVAKLLALALDRS